MPATAKRLWLKRLTPPTIHPLLATAVTSAENEHGFTWVHLLTAERTSREKLLEIHTLYIYIYTSHYICIYTYTSLYIYIYNFKFDFVTVEVYSRVYHMLFTVKGFRSLVAPLGKSKNLGQFFTWERDQILFKLGTWICALYPLIYLYIFNPLI